MLLGTNYAPSIQVDSYYVVPDLADYRVDYIQDESGRRILPDVEGQRVLFLSSYEADFMFDPQRTLDQLWVAAEQLLFPGLIERPDAERVAGVYEDGPLLVVSRVGLSDNGIVRVADLADERPSLFPTID